MSRKVTIAVGTALLAAGAASAQQAHPPQVMISPGPQAMPGDYYDLAQMDQLKVPLGPPAGKNTRPPRPFVQIPSPGPLAAKAAEAAVASCAADGYTVVVAITDSAGNLKAALAPDGTRDNGVYMAMHKAVTVVGFKMSTVELRMKAEKDPSILKQVTPNMSLLPGGLPIVKDGQFIGAIATSGASAYVEEKCARAGIDVILGKRS